MISGPILSTLFESGSLAILEELDEDDRSIPVYI